MDFIEISLYWELKMNIYSIDYRYVALAWKKVDGRELILGFQNLVTYCKTL
jgi:hypothetical protein